MRFGRLWLATILVGHQQADWGAPGVGEEEEEGYEDEYKLEDLDISAVNYIKPVSTPNFRKAWEETDPASEISDDYGLGVRDSLQVSLSSLTKEC